MWYKSIYVGRLAQPTPGFPLGCAVFQLWLWQVTSPRSSSGSSFVKWGEEVVVKWASLIGLLRGIVC